MSRTTAYSHQQMAIDGAKVVLPPTWCQAGWVKHRRYYIESLRTSGRVMPSRGGDLIVAAKEQTGDIDWELIQRSSKRWPMKQEPYDLEMSGPEGSFSGPAILVRSDGRSHVFRGVGVLEGVTEDDLYVPRPVD